jgi:hypothetical protein
MSDLNQHARAIGDIVVYELNRASKLAEAGLYTEASLRLGRAVEAGLYCIGRELGVDLTNRTIEQLNKLQNDIRSVEVNIIKKGSTSEIRTLCKLSTKLTTAVADLIEHDSQRSGQLSEEPRSTGQLFNEFCQLVDNETIKRRLKTNGTIVHKIQEHRNHAAHASLDGTVRERENHHYEEFNNDVEVFVQLLFELIVSQRAKRAWAVCDE